MLTCACQTTILFGLLVIILLLVFSAEACIKFFPTKTADGIWNDERNPKEFADCECGVSGEAYTYRPWNVYIHSSYGPGINDVKVCTGTIITSNLIATSHTCLTYPGKHPLVYQSWGVGLNQSVIPTDHIVVVAENLDQTTYFYYEFPVEEIILSFHYSLNDMVMGGWPKDNLALLRLSADVVDFTNHSHLRPACLPTPEDMASHFEALEKQMYYYSSAEVAPGEWWVQQQPAKGGIYRGRHCGIAPPYYKDDKPTVHRNISAKDERTLCVRVGSQSTFLPMEEGLVIPTYDANLDQSARIRGYLLGIHITSSAQNMGDDDRSLHFSSIVALTDYIEYKAKIHKSRWCRQPNLSTLTPTTLLFPPPTYLFGPWVWDYKFPPVVRSESLECKCGIRNDKGAISAQVVGGATAPPYAYGWMALLQVDALKNGEWKKFACGASIINDRVILTAAHCTADYNEEIGLVEEAMPESFTLEVNLHWRRKETKSIKLEIREIITHPGYFKYPIVNDFDVALVILEKPLSFVKGEGKGIRPVCLPNLANQIPVVGETGTLIGWGLTDHTNTSSIPDELQTIDLAVRDLADCNEVRARYGFSETTDTFLCIGDSKFNPWKNAAKGDSGGPFMFVDSTSKVHTQVALVSHANELINGEFNNVTGVRVHLVFFLDVQKVIPFIDYFSDRVGAKWCDNQ